MDPRRLTLLDAPPNQQDVWDRWLFSGVINTLFCSLLTLFHLQSRSQYALQDFLSVKEVKNIDLQYATEIIFYYIIINPKLVIWNNFLLRGTRKKYTSNFSSGSHKKLGSINILDNLCRHQSFKCHCTDETNFNMNPSCCYTSALLKKIHIISNGKRAATVNHERQVRKERLWWSIASVVRSFLSFSSSQAI